MIKPFILTLLFMLNLASAASTIPGNVNSINLSSDVIFKYSIVNDAINIYVAITCPGAISVGLGGSVMTGLDVAHLWWQNSKVNIVDRNYIDPPTPYKVLTDEERGGSNDFQDSGSTYDESTGKWVAVFSRKLNTGDKYDCQITDGGQIQISIAKFSTHTNWGNQHIGTYYKSIKMTSSLDQSTDTTTTNSKNSESSYLIFGAFTMMFLFAL